MQVFFIINLRELYNPNPLSMSEEEKKLNDEVNRRLHMRLTKLNQLLEDKLQKIEDSKSVWGSIEKEVTTDIIKLIGLKGINLQVNLR